MISPHDHTLFWIDLSDEKMENTVIHGEPGLSCNRDMLFLSLEHKDHGASYRVYLTKDQAARLGEELLEWSEVPVDSPFTDNSLQEDSMWEESCYQDSDFDPILNDSWYGCESY